MSSNRVLSVDYVEFWCGNSKINSKFYCDSFGFSPLAIKGLETGEKRFSSRAVHQQSLKLLFTSCLQPELDLSLDPTTKEHEIKFRSQLARHGDHIKDIAFIVSDVHKIYETALANGAIPIMSPKELKDEKGTVIIARIGTPFGDLEHTLIDRSGYQGAFLPGFRSLSQSNEQENNGDSHNFSPTGFGISHIDHVALAYEKGKVTEVLQWYHDCLGFEHFLCSEEDSEEGMTIQGQDGGIKTLVAACSSDEKFAFKFVFVEALPDSGRRRKNQVQEFLDYNGGAGVQHMALHTLDIVPTVRSIKNNGVELITVPSTYYDALILNEGKTLEEHGENRSDLEQLGILVDVNKEKHLLMQTFTAPLADRPTFFLELISRKGSDGFGKKTIKALFEAVERLQESRKPVPATIQ